jgi:hypothetical protein
MEAGKRSSAVIVNEGNSVCCIDKVEVSRFLARLWASALVCPCFLWTH